MATKRSKKRRRTSSFGEPFPPPNDPELGDFARLKALASNTSCQRLETPLFPDDEPPKPLDAYAPDDPLETLETKDRHHARTRFFPDRF